MDRSPAADATPAILLVEDEAIIALSERRMLERHGYRVSVASSGDSAVACIRDGFDCRLVLMDIDLGAGIDGTEAAAQILALKDIPIVFLTSHSEREMVERVKGITRYGYVLKSSGEFVLIQAVEMALELFASRRETLEREAWYRSVVNLTGEIIAQHDLDGRWTYLNERARAFWGLGPGEGIGASLFDYVHAEDVHTTGDVIREMLNERAPIRRRVNRQRTPRGWRTVEWNSEIIRTPDGEPVGIQATGRDVTDRTEMERLLDSLSKGLPGFIYAAEQSPAGGIRVPFVSSSVARLLGIEPAAITADASVLLNAIHPDDRPRMDEEIARLLAKPEPHAGLVHMVRRDGTSVWVRVHSAPEMLADGTVRWVCVALDWTNQMETERALSTTELKFRILFEQSPMGIILADAQSNIVDVNVRAAEMLGYQPDELIGQHAHLVIPEEARRARPVAETVRSLDAGEAIDLISTYRRKDGTVFHATVTVGRLRGYGGRVDHAVMFADISEQTAAAQREHELLREQELLLRELHHRVKNDFNLVHGLLMLQADSVPSSEARDALHDTASRIAVLGRLYAGMVSETGASDVALQPFLQSHLEGMRRATLPERISLWVDVADVRVPRRLAVSIGIIVNELVSNVAKHSQGDGTCHAVVTCKPDSEGSLRLSIQTDGPRYPGDVLNGRAYGYGLTIVHALAVQHEASLTLTNSTGATAEIVIPLQR